MSMYKYDQVSHTSAFINFYKFLKNMNLFSSVSIASRTKHASLTQWVAFYPVLLFVHWTRHTGASALVSILCFLSFWFLLSVYYTLFSLSFHVCALVIKMDLLIELRNLHMLHIHFCLLLYLWYSLPGYWALSKCRQIRLSIHDFSMLKK